MTQLLRGQTNQRSGETTMPPIKKSEPPKKPNPSLRPTSTLTTIGEFVLDGLLCEFLRVHEKSEGLISTETLIKRGKLENANMGEVDGEFLFWYKDKIPPHFTQTTIVFPKWTIEKVGEKGKKDKFIESIDNKGVDWPCLQSFPEEYTWDSSCVLVRFSLPKDPALLLNP